MKRLSVGALFGVLALFPMMCHAAWVIHLKDGRRFETPEYREEGDQIRFKRYGGVIGLPKDEIQRIEEVADLPEKELPAPPKKPSVSEKSVDEAKGQETPSNSAKAAKEKAPDRQKSAAQLAYMKEKRRILEEKEGVLEAFKAAKKAQNKAKKDMLWQRLFQLRERLRTLQEKVIAENDGVLPSWWDQIP